MTQNDVKAIMAKSSKKGTLAGLKHTDLTAVLSSMRAQISQAVPAGITPDRIIQMAANLVAKNPKIGECSAASVIGAVMEAAVLGFRPVSGLGQCYFVPYGGHVQFQIGYRGWIELARRSGQIKMLYAKTVHEGDEFIQEYGLSPKLVHKPGVKRGKMTHVYAVAHLNGGGEVFEVLTYEDVERLRVRNASQRGNPSGAWASDYEEMAKAKAVKRLAKYLPLSDEMLHAGVADDAFIPDTALSNNNSGIDPEELTYEIEIEPETEKEQAQ